MKVRQISFLMKKAISKFKEIMIQMIMILKFQVGYGRADVGITILSYTSKRILNNQNMAKIVVNLRGN